MYTINRIFFNSLVICASVLTSQCTKTSESEILDLPDEFKSRNRYQPIDNPDTITLSCDKKSMSPIHILYNPKQKFKFESDYCFDPAGVKKVHLIFMVDETKSMDFSDENCHRKKAVLSQIEKIENSLKNSSKNSFRVSLFAFSDRVFDSFEGVSGSNAKSQVENMLCKTKRSKSTDFLEALSKTAAIVTDKSEQKIVFLLTDGFQNPKNLDLVERKSQEIRNETPNFFAIFLKIDDVIAKKAEPVLQKIVGRNKLKTVVDAENIGIKLEEFETTANGIEKSSINVNLSVEGGNLSNIPGAVLSSFKIQGKSNSHLGEKIKSGEFFLQAPYEGEVVGNIVTITAKKVGGGRIQNKSIQFKVLRLN